MTSQKYLTFLALFTILAVGAYAHGHHHQCVHDKIAAEYTPEVEPAMEGRMLLNGIEDVNKPFRVFFDASALANVGTQEQRTFITDVLLPLAKSFFETRLTVRRRTSPIKFPANADKCYQAIVPPVYKTTGVDADLLILVTAASSQESFTAWATACLTDSVNRRPIVGQINFNLNYLGLKPQEFEANIGTTLHELTHVLGFSSNAFVTFIDPVTGKSRDSATIVKKATRRGFSTTLLITPKVLDLARKHYGCPTLEGVELENQGSSGSLGSHFERTVLMNEAMTASRIENRAYSKFTLAVLEDSGWYVPNYNLSDEFFFGAGAGCDMAVNACQAASKPREYCYAQGEACSIDFYSKGRCSTEGFADNCLYVSSYGNGDCRVADNAYKPNLPATGEIYGPESKCVFGSLLKQGYVPSTNESPKCVQYSCANGLVVLKVNSGASATCAQDGQKVQIAGYTGTLTCPPKKLFCETYYEACPNYCSGRGKCIEGRCMCAPGRKGADCSILGN